jgi:hypothetical protein
VQKNTTTAMINNESIVRNALAELVVCGTIGACDGVGGLDGVCVACAHTKVVTVDSVTTVGSTDRPQLLSMITISLVGYNSDDNTGFETFTVTKLFTHDNVPA